MTKETSWYVRKLERSARRCEKKADKIDGKIEALKQKHQDGKISRAKLQQKSQDLESKIRVLRSITQTARGKIGKERRRMAEDSA
jgi:peptidoglycan hydrolase CwlO-like protein